MVFLLAEWQQEWLARWRPALWLPSVAARHRFEAKVHVAAQTEAAKAEAVQQLLSRLRALRGAAVTTEDAARGFTCECFRFHGILQHLHVIKVRGVVVAGGLDVTVTSGSASAVPGWTPLAPLAAALLCWLPFEAMAANEESVSRTLHRLEIGSAPESVARQSLVSPQSQFFVAFIAVPCFAVMFAVLQSGIVGPPQ